jgi:muramoyltetrapeptide carboxypeptidase
MKKPSALKPGDTIRVVASSSPFNHEDFYKGIKLLQSWGFKTRYQKNIFSKKPYLAGSDKRRAAEFVSALQDKEAKAILFARGGYGSMRILPYLDKQKLPTQPKIILGYSDITALHGYFHKRGKWTTFYGPVVSKDIHEKASATTLKSLKNVLTQTTKPQPFKSSQLVVVKKGSATGPLIGGCLSLIVSLIGTPYDLNTDGKILFLEDINEKPYKIDRMLTHMKLAGKFKKCRGLIFSIPGPNPKEHYIATLKDVFQDFRGPIVFNFPAGHTKVKLTVPLGVNVRLNTKNKSLEFLEAALR